MLRLPLAAAAALALTPLAVPAQTPGPGVSHALAQARAARLSDLHYKLSFALTPHASTTPGQETLSFSDSGSGPLALDFRDGTLASAVLNGTPIPTTDVDGHLILPAAALHRGPNQLVTRFTANIAPAGKALTRYEDKDDGSEYVYTLFVPMDASMAFPCFDQPDLKARFTLTVQHPAAWTVIANTAPSATSTPEQAVFPETRPISTYVFAFTAGPWQRLPGSNPGEPALFVRKSQLSRAKTEAPQVQAITARGIAYLTDFFQQPFPFPKYDLVLIPGFPFGGMEHAGATFLNEDGVLFRTAPTEADYFRRDTLVLHETTHQWFGDLVTMRWFDDLWLKEGFAQYMAYKALAQLEPQQQPWKHFYEDIKPLAYAIDETQGTTPIFQNIANLKDAKSAYGAIVYQKAPAVLKQLDYFLGEQNFRDGLRLYLRQHAYANAQWADLVNAFEQAATANHQPKDVQSWAKAWILQRGMPQVDTTFTCSDGKIAALTLTQHDVLGTAALWPISNQIALASPTGTETLKTSWNTASHPVTEAVGKPCPTYVFSNAGDFGYGRFLLDPVSEKAVIPILSPLVSEMWERTVVPTPPKPEDPLLRTQLWGALWDDVRIAQSSPSRYVELAIKSFNIETDESIARIQGGRIATALHLYLGPKSRADILQTVELAVAFRMFKAPTAGLRIVSFRIFTNVAEDAFALKLLKDIQAHPLEIPGLTLRPLDRWNIIGHLLAMHDPEAMDALHYEQAHDKSGEAQKYAFAVQAGIPTPEIKSKYWQDCLHNATLQEDWITQSLGPFNSWNQSALTEPYLAEALAQLPEIKAHRKIFFLGAWLNSFLSNQRTPEAQAIVQQWLAQPSIDHDLRLKVLESSDALNRTVLIRQKYPD